MNTQADITIKDVQELMQTISKNMYKSGGAEVGTFVSKYYY